MTVATRVAPARYGVTVLSSVLSEAPAVSFPRRHAPTLPSVTPSMTRFRKRIFQHPRTSRAERTYRRSDSITGVLRLVDRKRSAPVARGSSRQTGVVHTTGVVSAHAYA